MNDISRPDPPSKPSPPTAAPQPSVPGLQPPAAPPSGLSINAPKPKKRWYLVAMAAAGVGLVLIIAFFATGQWYNAALLPHSDTASKIRIEVAKGEGLSAVADNLQSAGVINSSLAAQIYMRTRAMGDIKAGTYLFSPTQTTREIVQWLNDGRVDTFRVTILPGKTLDDIKQELIHQGFAASDVDAAFAQVYQSSVLADKPPGANLEGYIFPETYFMNASATPTDVVKRSLGEFARQIEVYKLVPALGAHNLNLHQALTLASIVSGEATNLSDRRQIAQVFEKRLSLGMPLGSDITYMYAAKLLGVAPSPDIDSPYNTRKVKGFPPGPVSNFNIDALQAVANPSPGDFLFFVAGDDGAIHYAYTEAEHNDNVAKYCHKLCASN